MTAMTPHRSAIQAQPPEGAGTPPRYDVRALLREGRSAELILDGRAYSLRITRAGKLILTR